MEWKVGNALSRDVERQHLNKILAEIRAQLSATSLVAANPVVQTNTVVHNTAVARFILALTGAVTGSATVDGSGNVTLETTAAAGDLLPAPIDNQFYWQWNGEWMPVNPILPYLENTDGLPEGVDNLYFTDERAQDAVAAALANSDTVTWVYDDVTNTITAQADDNDSASFESGEPTPLTRGMAVCVVGGVLRRASAVAAFKNCIGLLDEDVLATGSTGKVQTDGIFTTTTLMWDAATGMVGGLAPYTTYYLTDTGAITPYASTTSGNYVAPIGYAISSTSLRIELNPTILR